MLWNKKLTRETIETEYNSLIAAGESKTSAFNHVNVQLDDILRDVIDNLGWGRSANDVSNLMQWWNCER